MSEFPDINEQTVTHPAPDRAALRAAAAKRVKSARHEDSAFDILQSPTQRMTALCEAAAAGATIAQMARAIGFHAGSAETITPLEPLSFAEPFEELRAASDAWQDEHRRRPRVFLANMGPIAHHTARATYSKNFFEGGGFEVLGNTGFRDAESAAAAFRESGAGIAVICSSDKLYPEFVPPVAAELKSAGARCVVLAGNPGENEQTWRAAGVDRFIFVKCNVLATLRDLLREEGVLDSDG